MNQQERDEYLDVGDTGPGWLPLIKELDSKMSELDPNYRINQIKEKFGGLRYYFSSSSNNADAMYDLEYEYEAKSFKICEYCGSEEDVTTEAGKGGWVKTFCKNCKAPGVDIRC
jgi:hypothetical protein